MISSGSRSLAIRGLDEHKQTAASALSGSFPHLMTVLPEPIGSDLFAELERQNVLVPVAFSDAEWAGSRLSGYVENKEIDPVKVKARLSSARVLILGIGGTGSVVLQHLVGAGVARLVLVDCDKVQGSDLERQFIFRRCDVGRSKLAAAMDYVLERNPDCDIQMIAAKISLPTDVEDVLAASGAIDAAAICIDDPPATAYATAATALWKAGIPFVHGGVSLESGFYGPFFDTRSGSPQPTHLPLWDPAFDRDAKPTSCCFPPFNTVVSALMAADVLHFLVGLKSSVRCDVRTFLDFRNGGVGQGRGL